MQRKRMRESFDEEELEDDREGCRGVALGSASERKRELERRRRDLVSQRFGELERQLRGGGAHGVSPDGCGKGRRIDKEAVLKEAVARLKAQDKEISELSARVKGMAAEIDILRAEKLELRKDKAYFRNDVMNLKEEMGRLRGDNVAMWQMIKKNLLNKNPMGLDAIKLLCGDRQKPPMMTHIISNEEQPPLQPTVSAPAPVPAQSDSNVDPFLATNALAYLNGASDEFGELLSSLNDDRSHQSVLPPKIQAQRKMEISQPISSDVAYCV